MRKGRLILTSPRGTKEKKHFGAPKTVKNLKLNLKKLNFNPFFLKKKYFSAPTQSQAAKGNMEPNADLKKLVKLVLRWKQVFSSLEYSLARES